MRRHLVAAPLCWALLTASGVAGVPAPPGYRMGDYRAPTPDMVPGGTVIHTDALKARLNHGGVALIDVLPAPRRPAGMRPGTPWMPEPHRDLPGSVWLPDVGWGAIGPALEAWFRDRLARATDGDKDRAVVFYCRRECWMSWNAAKRAASYGYRDVLWYPEGVDGWKEAGLALREATPEAPPG